MNPANKATMLRIILIPFFVACFYLDFPHSRVVACCIFIFASLTDAWDGWYARSHNLVTDFGKLMDPMADKLLTCTAFIMLLGIGKLHPVFVIIFIGRELIISAFRLIAAEKNIVIAAGKLGKVKTVLQCLAIIFLLLDNPFFGKIGFPFDQVLVWAAAFFTVWSCIDYIVRNKSVVSSK